MPEGSPSLPSSSASLRSTNIAEEFIARPAREHPEKTAIVGAARGLTYAQLESEVNQVACALRASACCPGDRVLIALRDSPEFIATFFGAVKMGAIAVPVNPMARSADYRHYLENSGARFAVVDAETLGEFSAGAAGRSLDVLIVCNQSHGSERPEPVAHQVFAWQDWLSKGANGSIKATTFEPAFFLYTSGSGGTPKAVVHHHHDMLAATHNYAQGVLGIRSDDRLLDRKSVV